MGITRSERYSESLRSICHCHQPDLDGLPILAVYNLHGLPQSSWAEAHLADTLSAGDHHLRLQSQSRLQSEGSFYGEVFLSIFSFSCTQTLPLASPA